MMMRYFDDLTFIGATRTPRCDAFVDRPFPDYWGIQFARSGSFHIDGGRGLRAVGPPWVWFTGPGPHFRYGVPPVGYGAVHRNDAADHAGMAAGPSGGPHWDHTYVTFRGDRVRRWLEGGLLPRASLGNGRPVADPAGLSNQLDRLMEDIHGGRSPWAVNRLEKILLRLQQDPPPPSNPDPLPGLLQELRQDPRTGFDMHGWCRQQGMSYSHFRARFKDLAGMAPHQFVLALRLEGVAGDLRKGAGTVVDVAARWGFEDPMHFHKLFKRRYGLTPGRFRDEARGS